MFRKILFQIAPSKQDAYPQVTNAPTETETALLMEMIQRHISGAFDPQDSATIIRTVRHQCPCCYPVLEGLIMVHDKLYQIRIGPKAMGNGPTEVSVEKLEKTLVFHETLRHHPVEAPLCGSEEGRRS